MNALKTAVAGAVILSWLLAGSAAWASRLLVVSLGNTSPDSLRRYSETTGAFLDTMADQGSLLNGIGGMAWEPDGNLYLGGRGNNNVVRYDGRTGALLGEVVPGGSGGLSSPFALTFGPDGNLYVADSTQVLRYNGQSGEFLGVFVSAGSGGLQVPGPWAFVPTTTCTSAVTPTRPPVRRAASCATMARPVPSSMPLCRREVAP